MCESRLSRLRYQIEVSKGKSDKSDGSADFSLLWRSWGTHKGGSNTARRRVSERRSEGVLPVPPLGSWLGVRVRGTAHADRGDLQASLSDL
jgi:hypothetical protein